MTVAEFFRENPAAAVAFSGGVDSAWLLHQAARYARRTAAYFILFTVILHTVPLPALDRADIPCMDQGLCLVVVDKGAFALYDVIGLRIPHMLMPADAAVGRDHHPGIHTAVAHQLLCT